MNRKHPRRTAVALTLSAAALVGVGLTAAQAEDTPDARVTLGLPVDAREGAPLRISARGSAEGELVVGLTRTACTQPDAAVEAIPATPVHGELSAEGTTSVAEPGAWRACAWVRPPGEPASVVAEQRLPVRAARAVVSLAAPTADAVLATGATELPRTLFLVATERRTTCTARDFRWSSDDSTTSVAVKGRFEERWEPPLWPAGRYTVCAFLADSEDDPRAVAAAQTTLVAQH